jgi:hypothetical protein
MCLSGLLLIEPDVAKAMPPEGAVVTIPSLETLWASDNKREILAQLSRGHKVRLESYAGTVTGKFDAMSGDTVVVLTGSAEQRLDLSHIQRVSRQNGSVKRGFVQGALIGLGTGVVLGLMVNGIDGAGGFQRGAENDSGSVSFALPVVGAVVGATIGMFNATKWKQVYPSRTD